MPFPVFHARNEQAGVNIKDVFTEKNSPVFPPHAAILEGLPVYVDNSKVGGASGSAFSVPSILGLQGPRVQSAQAPAQPRG